MARQRLRGAAWAALTLAATASVVMADGIPSGSLKDTSTPDTINWRGFYIGGHAGIATGDTQGDVTGLTTTDFNLNGGLYGGQVGYNWQRGFAVLGIEGSWSQSTIQGNTACLIVFDCKRDVDWVATLTGRVGMAFNHTLLYGMAGVAWGDVNTNVSIAGVPLLNGSESHAGWVAGFGMEQMLLARISFCVEYAHIDLGSEDHQLSFVGGGGPALTDKLHIKMDTIRLGVNIKLH
jgi:outer membrane immunogenic protein